MIYSILQNKNKLNELPSKIIQKVYIIWLLYKKTVNLKIHVLQINRAFFSKVQN